MAAALSWIAAGGAQAAGLAVRARSLAEGIYAAAFAVALYGLLNAVIPRTVRIAVNLPNLPAYWHGRTVALVSDVHLGNIRGRAFVRHLVWRLQRRSPEAVFISGDMFDGTRLDAERAASPWGGLRPPSGMYFVSGNHDERGKRNLHVAALERTGIRVLHNEKIVVRGLQVIGVHDTETHRPELYARILRRAAIDPDCASLLLAHQPINLDVAEAAGISLQVSGHTHGGQFWPWSLLARRVHGEFVYGLNRFGRLMIYTSSGAGTWGPPFRVGTRSEIVFLTLHPAA
ncbi:MAG TPA: metallophosphoesterase [Opitutaceae bacterium]|nr:metallophosphoesterase [Opitutaceae bacterium]